MRSFDKLMPKLDQFEIGAIVFFIKQIGFFYKVNKDTFHDFKYFIPNICSKDGRNLRSENACLIIVETKSFSLVLLPSVGPNEF